MSRFARNAGSSTTSPHLTWKPPGAVRLARKPALYWAIAALLAAITGFTVHQMVSEAEAARAEFGDTVEVFVTSATIDPTRPLQSQVEQQAVPLALVPVDAVKSLPPLAVAGRSVSAGAVLTIQDLASQIHLGPAEAAVALPVGPTTPALSAGQPVLLVVNADPFVGVESAQLPARVHAVDADKVTIAINRADLTTVSAALAIGSITIALI